PVPRERKRSAENTQGRPASCRLAPNGLRAGQGQSRTGSECAQPRRKVALEQLHEALLIVTGGVEDEVVEAGIRVLLDLGNRLVWIGADDPALGDLFDRQRVGGLLH